MKKVFAMFIILTVLQFVHSQQNRIIVDCYKKLTSQINSLKTMKKLPECVNKTALKQAMDETKVFKDIYKEIYDACKKTPLACTDTIHNTLGKKENQIKGTLKQIVTQLTQALSGCYKDLDKNMSNISGYISNGCETPKH